MAKSFELTFDMTGAVTVSNIQGVEGSECLDLTRPFIEAMEDKNNPAITIMNEPPYIEGDLTDYAD